MRELTAGMRRAVGLAVVVGALVVPGGAEAGTYDVVSCSAPGANGRNNSLVWETGSLDPQYTPMLASWYDADATCADGLVARSSPVNDGREAKWLTGARWTFVAPAGTTIVAMTSWRYGFAHDHSTDDPSTPSDESDHWRSEVVDGATGQAVGGPLGGDTCHHGMGVTSCSVGRPGGEPRTHASLNTTKLDWGVSCVGEIVGGCPTAGAPGPLASMAVYGTRVTLEDPSPPTAALGGALVTPGWHRPDEPITYAASDNSGIRSATLTAGALTGADGRSCDFTYRVPCANAQGRPLAFQAPLPDGRYPVTLTVADAARNVRRVTANVAIDGTPPAVDLRPSRKRRITIGVSDRASGFASGQIAVRNDKAEPFRPLPTRFRKGKLRAKVARGKAKRATVQVTVSDKAGNTITGVPARFRITSVTSRNLRAHVRRGGKVRVKHGARVTVRGQLVLSAGQPLEGVPITVTSRPIGRRSVPYAEARATVGANGRFVVGLPKGPARVATVRMAGVPGGMPAERSIKLLVPASSTIKASRTRLTGPGRVQFSGRVRDGRRNLVVVLQGFERGRWRTFADARTGKAGRWRASYRFSGLPGDYPVRVRIRRQANLPYATGHSRHVTIRVR